MSTIFHRKMLQKAGFVPCGNILAGDLQAAAHKTASLLRLGYSRAAAPS
jgi:hypothetical protein